MAVFSSALSESSTSLIGNTGLISKVYFPRLIIPLSAIGTAFVDFLIGLAFLAVLIGGTACRLTSGWRRCRCLSRSRGCCRSASDC